MLTPPLARDAGLAIVEVPQARFAYRFVHATIVPRYAAAALAKGAQR